MAAYKTDVIDANQGIVFHSNKTGGLVYSLGSSSPSCIEFHANGTVNVTHNFKEWPVKIPSRDWRMLQIAHQEVGGRLDFTTAGLEAARRVVNDKKRKLETSLAFDELTPGERKDFMVQARYLRRVAAL